MLGLSGLIPLAALNGAAGLGDVAVFTRDERVRRLDDCQVRTHRVEDVPQFDGDVAATHDDEVLRDHPQRERVLTGESVDLVHSVDRWNDGTATRRGDDPVGRDVLAAEDDRSVVDDGRVVNLDAAEKITRRAASVGGSRVSRTA